MMMMLYQSGDNALLEWRQCFTRMGATLYQNGEDALPEW